MSPWNRNKIVFSSDFGTGKQEKSKITGPPWQEIDVNAFVQAIYG
jgi:hypothetical protein